MGLHADFRERGYAVVPGIIRAFNAETLEEIWNSQEVPSRDPVGTYAKFVPPLVVNGKVYMPTFNNAVVVYGLLPDGREHLNQGPGGRPDGDIGNTSLLRKPPRMKLLYRIQLLAAPPDPPRPARKLRIT